MGGCFSRTKPPYVPPIPIDMCIASDIKEKSPSIKRRKRPKTTAKKRIVGVAMTPNGPIECSVPKSSKKYFISHGFPYINYSEFDKTIELEDFFPNECKLEYRRRNLTVIRVIKQNDLETLWWNQIIDLRVNKNVIIFDVVINSVSNTISTWCFDENFKFPVQFQQFFPQKFNKYFKSARINEYDYSLDELERCEVLKTVFKKIIKISPSDTIGLHFSGHGSGEGDLFERYLTKVDIVQDFFKDVTSHIKSKKFIFGMFGENCLEASRKMLDSRSIFFKYIIASSLSVGGFPLDDEYVFTVCKNYWGEPISITEQNYYIKISGDEETLDANILNALRDILLVYYTIWTQDAILGIKMGKIKQILSIFDSDKWLLVKENLNNPDFESFLEESKFVIKQVSTRDLFEWNVHDYGFNLQLNE